MLKIISKINIKFKIKIIKQKYEIDCRFIIVKKIRAL